MHVYHKSCFKSAFPQYKGVFQCLNCKENNPSIIQKEYENLLVGIKCRIIHLRKVQELFPVVSGIVEEFVKENKMTRKDVQDFIVGYLHFFENEMFQNYKKNVEIFEKINEAFKEENILITKYSLYQMLSFNWNGVEE